MRAGRMQGDERMWAVATARIGGKATPCLHLRGRLYPFPSLATGLPESALGLFADWAAAAARFDRIVGEIELGKRRPMWVNEVGAELLAPLHYPGKILCAGANYYDHMAEMGFPDVKKETQRLFFFLKAPHNAVVGPGDTVVMPRGTKKYDWEIELAAVIGRTARYVAPHEALAHVAGYTVAIDMSARDFNQAPDQFYKFDWVAGKATDTGCPLGPWIVPAAAIADPQNVAFETFGQRRGQAGQQYRQDDLSRSPSRSHAPRRS